MPLSVQLSILLSAFVLGAGGGTASGPAGALRATLGQPLAGTAANAASAVRAGFWADPGTGTTPVILADFHAAWTPGGIAIVWRIAGEPVDHAGFHVWRSVAGGPEMRITTELVTGGPGFRWIDPGPPSGVVSYRLAEISRSGVTTWYGPITVTLAGAAPALALLQNRPNPFRGTTHIRFQTPRPGRARLVVYDVAGRAVATLVDEDLPAGVYEADWNAMSDAGSRVAAGVYLYRLETAAGGRSLKLIILP